MKFFLFSQKILHNWFLQALTTLKNHPHMGIETDTKSPACLQVSWGEAKIKPKQKQKGERLTIKQRNNGFLEYLLLSAPPRKEMKQHEKRKNRRATKESMEAMIVILTKELMQERWDMKKDRKELPNKQDEKIENVRKEKEPTLREVKTKKGWNKV